MRIKARLALYIFLFGLGITSALVGGYYHFLYQPTVDHTIAGLVDYAEERAPHLDHKLETEIENGRIISVGAELQDALKEDDAHLSKMPPEERERTLEENALRWKTEPSSSPFFLKFTQSAAAGHLKKIMSLYPGKYREIFLTNRYGATVAATGPLSTFGHDGEYWWKAAFAGGAGRIFIDDGGVDLGAGDYVLGITVPVKRDDSVIGVLRINARMSAIFPQPRGKSQYTAASEIFLARGSGAVMLSPEKEPFGKRLGAEIARKMSAKKSFYVKSGGEIIAFAPSPMSTGGGALFGGKTRGADRTPDGGGDIWFLGVKAKYGDITSVAHHDLALVLLVSLMVVLASAAAGWIIGNRIGAPVQELARFAARLGSGEWSHRMPITTGDELGLLASAMNKMADDLRTTAARRDDLLVEIEKRKRSEVASDKAKQLAQSYLDVAGVMLLALNRAGEITMINRKGLEMLNVTEKEALGKDWFGAFLPEEIAARIKSAFAGLMEGNITPMEYYENLVRTADGREILMAFHNSLVLDAHGAVIGSLSSGEDVTARVKAKNALKESEARYKRITEGLTDYQYTVRVENGVAAETIQSPACQKVTGYTPEEYLANPYLWIDMAPPEDRLLVRDRISLILAGKQVPPIEHRIIRKDGMVRWIRDTIILFNDASGKLLSYDGVIKDITESRQASEALQESEGRHRAIMESANDAMVCADAAGRIYMWNGKAAQIFGYTEEEAIGKNVHELITPSHYRGPAGVGFARFTSTGAGPLLNKTTETRAIRKDGSEFPIDLSIARVRMKDGWGASAIIRDISEKKSADMQIRRMAAAIDQAHEGVLITGPDGRIEYVNSGVEKITGYAPGELIGANPRVFKSGHQDAAFYKNMWDTVKAGQIWRGRLVNRKKNGDFFHEEMTISPVFDEAENIVNFIAVKTDISGKLLMEQQLIQAEKLSTVGAFVSGVAHEINNPLTSILGYAQMLSEKEDAPEDMRAELRIIAQQSRRVVDIVRNLLKFSRHSPEETRPISVNEVVQSVFELHGYRLRVDGVVAENDMAKNMPDVIGNFTQLQQVFLNIVVNAHHAMVQDKGKGRIVTRSREIGSEAVVIIENDGPRIPEALMDRIFDPFFTTKKVGEGTGLGLFVSYGIIKEHGGRIWCENMAEGGVRFTVALPMARERDIQDSHPAAPKDKSALNLRVLHVDDEEHIRQMAAAALAMRGIFSLSADSAVEAINLLEEHEFDVIVSDLKMPGADGYSLGAWLRERRPAMMKKLIIATGAVDQRLMDFCAAHGCRILEKPFDDKDLVSAVATAAAS
jgi:PAS domain S-box-containing protein